jgi:hypothetical protein
MNKPRWGEKTPGNEQNIATLLEWFPEGRVIFSVRDPRAISSSLIRVPWYHNHVYLHALTWKNSMNILKQWKNDFRVSYVMYESMVKNPEMQAKKMCRFLGEEYNSEMIFNRDGAIPVVKRDNWRKEALVKAMNPIHQQSINTWKSALSSYQINVLENIIRDEMVNWDYDCVGQPLGFFEKCDLTREKFFQLSARIFRKLYKNILRKKR